MELPEWVLEFLMIYHLYKITSLRGLALVAFQSNNLYGTIFLYGSHIIKQSYLTLINYYAVKLTEIVVYFCSEEDVHL